MVEPRPGAAEVDIHVLPVFGGVDDHNALFFGGAAGGIGGLHIDLEADVGASVEFKVDGARGVGDVEVGLDGEGDIGDAVGDVHGSIALTGTSLAGGVFVPDDGVEEGAEFGGLEGLEHLHVGDGDGIGGGEGVEAEGVADDEGLAVDADGFVESVVGEGAGDAAMFDGGVELEVVDLAGMEHGDGEGQLEETYGVEFGALGIVGYHIAGNNVGCVETGFQRDGVGSGGDNLDGVDMQERGRDEVLVIGASGEK